MIQWREGLSIGVESIDNDHKQLIGIINEFLSLSRQDPPPDKLKEIADRLLHYANAHFEREERLQLLAHYEEYDGHKIQHNGLLDALESFIDRYFVAQTDPIDDLALTQMDGFLRTWLIDHILKCDVRMRGKLAET